MTDEHYRILESKLAEEVRLPRKYEGFSDCIYYTERKCKALLVHNCRVHGKCNNYRKNPAK